jgi:hypothetical protein
MSEVHSHQLDEQWRPIYPQNVAVGEICRMPVNEGLYLTLRCVQNSPTLLKFEHAIQDRIELQGPPWRFRA